MGIESHSWYRTVRQNPLIVTIDGPAGAGKSSTARALAKRLGFRFLDTGAMYRAVAWAAVQRGIRWDDTTALIQLAQSLRIEVNDDKTLVDNEDVSEDIRLLEVTNAVRFVADVPDIRRRLIELQHHAAAGDDIVTEGRDQGTVAFPDAECKIFLTASAEQRAQRRFAEMSNRGEQVSLDTVLAKQNERDQRDRSREFGRLVAADDAITVSTDGLSLEQVVDRIVEIVEQRRSIPHHGIRNDPE